MFNQPAAGGEIGNPADQGPCSLVIGLTSPESSHLTKSWTPRWLNMCWTCSWINQIVKQSLFIDQGVSGWYARTEKWMDNLPPHKFSETQNKRLGHEVATFSQNFTGVVQRNPWSLFCHLFCKHAGKITIFASKPVISNFKLLVSTCSKKWYIHLEVLVVWELNCPGAREKLIFLAKDVKTGPEFSSIHTAGVKSTHKEIAWKAHIHHNSKDHINIYPRKKPWIAPHGQSSSQHITS